MNEESNRINEPGDPCPNCGSTNTFVYDRFIYANQKSRRRSQGDLIRGDIPIIPTNNAWFNMSCGDCEHHVN
jgi:hypothetical protein